MNENKINQIVILMAMQEEADGVIASLDLTENFTKLSSSLPFRHFEGQLNGVKLNIITSGIDHRNQVDNIGCEAATLMAYESIVQFSPDIIISAGTAGGFAKNNACIGTVYASEKYFVFHDRIVPLPGFRESAIGHFPATDVKRMAKNLSIKTGIISSGSSLEKNSKDKQVLEEHGVVAKEMEAAAVAWVAMLHNVPVLAIKSITNLVDLENQSENEFLKNFDYAVKCLHDKLIEVLEYVQGKSISDLS